jgi:beta-lactamase superfamily II metal-dependent hydrolase
VAQLTRVNILWCGQGMTTLVEGYRDGVVKQKADYLALVDCGGNTEWGQHAIDYIAGKVLATDTKKLDALIISHQDKDHVVLLKGLGEKFEDEDVTVDEVFLGGLAWETSNMTTVENFLNTVDYDLDYVTFDAPKLSHYTGVKEPSKLRYWDQFGKVKIRALVSGLVTTGRPDIRKNASSAVVVVDDGTWAVVLPGDATYQTMDAVNQIKNINTLLRPVFALEIPHHGALRTAVEEYVANKDPSEFNFDIITKFAEIVAPHNVAASAGPWNGHKHPIEEVLEVFDPHLATTNDHTYVSYVFSRPDGITHKGWTEFEEVTYTEWCTVHAIANTATKSKSKFKLVKTEGRYNGPFVAGDITFDLQDGLPPEEMVRFHPVGIIGPDPAGELVPFAPAP